MSDLIERQAAKEALQNAIKEVNHELWELEGSMCYCEMVSSIGNALDGVPAAQPEIIRCKDCRWGREACGNIECFADTNVPPEYHGYEWFCPNGEGRTGTSVQTAAQI